MAYPAFSGATTSGAGSYTAPAVPLATPAHLGDGGDGDPWGTSSSSEFGKGSYGGAGMSTSGIHAGFGGAPPQPSAPMYGAPGAAPVTYPATGYGGGGGGGGGGMGMTGMTVDVPLHSAGTLDGSVAPEPLPTAADQPVYEPGAKDVWAGALFWLHALVVVILAFALGVSAIKADGARGDTAPRNGALDLNASLFVRMFVLAAAVSATTAVAFFYLIKRYAATIIMCALYTSVVVQLVLACIMFAVAPVAAFFLLLCAALTACYAYFVRPRVPFAAAHLVTAVDAVNAYPMVVAVAGGMLLVQALWVVLWGMAALGVVYAVDKDAGTSSSAAANGGGGGNKGSAGGGIFAFLLLVSLYWGTATFRAVVHFVTAAVVGNWWFLGAPALAVTGSLQRAFTSNFGSLALGSLITAVLRALEATARSAERSAARNRNAGTAFLAACAVCLLRCVRRAVEYFNQWAIIFVALTGASYMRAGKEAVALFQKRGWSAIINDDLVGTAMGIVALMVAALAAAVGGGVAYSFTGGASSAAGLVAFFCFITGLVMTSVMTGILTSAVRTVFVCFAMNPAALAATHPTHLTALVNAWHVAHPAALAACGYSAAYLPGGAV